ncbi:ATP-binding protein [Paraburkholderia madseniana]
MKYTPPGGDITLLVEAPDLCTGSIHDSSPRTAVITARDNGAGMSSSLLPHVFDMFAQSASSRRHAEGGIGIGPAVVKHLVTAHNGTVKIESAGKGQGTAVTLQLPIVCERAGEAPMTARRTTTPTRILVVDDSADATGGTGQRSEMGRADPTHFGSWSHSPWTLP